MSTIEVEVGYNLMINHINNARRKAKADILHVP